MIEEAPRPGGVISSVRRNGALYKLGPNSGLDTTPLVNELLAAAGIRGERIDAEAAAAKRYILRDGALVPLPTSPPAFIASPLFSWRAKLALAREPFIARVPAGAEESVAAFVRCRLGTEFLDYAIEPFVAGIYAGDPERLSLPAAFPRLHALEQQHGSLIRGHIAGAAAGGASLRRRAAGCGHRARGVAGAGRNRLSAGGDGGELLPPCRRRPYARRLRLSRATQGSAADPRLPFFPVRCSPAAPAGKTCC